MFNLNKKIMGTGSIKVLENVKINQNIICLIVSFIFLYYSKDCCCHSWIYGLSKILFWISFISVCISSVVYIIEYCAKKIAKTKTHICNLCSNDENKKSESKSTSKRIIICPQCPLKDEI